MSKFIRTKEGIYDAEKWRGNIENRGEKSFLAIGVDYRGCTCYNYEEILNQADTIEELFMPNDLLIVGDDKNQMPIFIESIEYLKSWLWGHDIYKIKEFYIKNGNDFKCVAKQSEKGDLELI